MASEFGEAALRAIGKPPDEAVRTATDVLRRDAEWPALQMTGGAWPTWK
ncbi:hypothetical protein J7E62_20840 [Variovorax paradoxus]|nr:hypothetical protein [Variovorax paradoxus]